MENRKTFGPYYFLICPANVVVVLDVSDTTVQFALVMNSNEISLYITVIFEGETSYLSEHA